MELLSKDTMLLERGSRRSKEGLYFWDYIFMYIWHKASFQPWTSGL